MPQFEGALPGEIASKGPLERGTVPKLVGNFNIPKAVIENKVDVLTFLELLVRKGLTTAQEIDEIREIVVQYLNGLYPELNLSYTMPNEKDELINAVTGKKPPSPAPALPAVPKSMAGLNLQPQFPGAGGPAPNVPVIKPAPPQKPVPRPGGAKKSSSLFGDMLPPELRDKL